ncbi:DUF1501 domain-containing protein [Saccharicrinis fermentans]|uniref:Secretion system C-terminal sorting domain-containing protein n=2 Tax=Saccharicrinis fermentans TaxID=982 RepID=W7Y608_9BACT|nr:DUF1501 domain-containing protein [Saccharicrinis fermentans]GAF03562.1 hypothetical protein JCM21142_52240 [Saccharicrinis fermentans DSM 9555 = JCM 21142]
MYHLSSAIKAFQDDLANLGLEDKVLTMTFTEFGRRVKSNDSYGTDHGTSTPVFVFGKAVKSQVVGDNPDLSDLVGGNMKYQVDYRQVYTSVLQDWFGAGKEALEAARFSEFVDSRIDIFGLDIGVKELEAGKVNAIAFPIPATDTLTFQFNMPMPGNAVIKLFDVNGRMVYQKRLNYLYYGSQTFVLRVSSLPAGQYVFTVGTNQYTESGKVIVKR